MNCLNSFIFLVLSYGLISGVFCTDASTNRCNQKGCRQGDQIVERDWLSRNYPTKNPDGSDTIFVPQVDKRPDWLVIRRLFQETHFGIRGRSSLDLCHRLSWNNMRCMLDRLFEYAWTVDATGYNKEGYSIIRKFLDRLFEFDNEAVVNFGPWYPPLNAWSGGQWWTIPQTPRQFFGDYITTNSEIFKKWGDYSNDYSNCLNKENLNFYNERIGVNGAAKKNYDCIKKILSRVYNSPANLRMGNRVANSGNGKCFDPMGNRQGQMTQWEQNLVKDYLPYIDFYYPDDIIKGEGQNADACYIISSSGSMEFCKDESEDCKWGVQFFKTLNNVNQC